MIALLLPGVLSGPAAADGIGTAGDREGLSECTNSSPIAGTAGFRNARAAITTNAQTYGAAQWAERTLFPMIHREDRPGDWEGAAAMDTSMLFTAARTMSIMGTSCPDHYRVSSQPVDLGASNFGFVARKGRFGFYYAGSIVWSGPGDPNNITRAMQTGGYYLWGTVASMTAPALMWMEYDEGVGTIAPDFMVGGTADLDYAWVEAGYVGSSGFYGHVQEGKVGFFGSALLKLGLAQLPFYRAGAERIESPAGLSTVYARKLPIQALQGTSEGGTAATEDDGELESSLQTGHLEQYNLFGILDLQAAYAWRPAPALYEAQLALHTKDYHAGRKANAAAEAQDGLRGQTRSGAMIRGGVVQLPDLWFYGVEGGMRPTVRGEATLAFPQDGGTAVYSKYELALNDPETLALFPYAYNAVSFKVRLWMAF